MSSSSWYRTSDHDCQEKLVASVGKKKTKKELGKKERYQRIWNSYKKNQKES